MNTIQDISSSEWEVMKVIWSLDVATSKEVGEILKTKQDWEVATTKTLLGRLVKKGFLNTEKVSNYFVYHPTIVEQQGSMDRVNDAVSSICSKKVGDAILNIIDQYDLSQSDHDAIIKALGNKQLVESVKCQCLKNCTCAPGTCNCA